MNYRNRTLATLILLTALALACSSARDDPLLSAEELYTPTPVPVDTPVASDTPAEPETKTGTPAEPEAEATAEPVDLFGFDYNGKVAFAQWDDPSVQMENFIVGYIMVHGMVYEMELVEVGESDYPSRPFSPATWTWCLRRPPRHRPSSSKPCWNPARCWTSALYSATLPIFV